MNHSTMHRTAPSTRNICGPQVTSALVENSCPGGLVCIPVDTQPPAVANSRKVPYHLPSFSFIIIYFLSIGSFLSAYKHALIFLILKKSSLNLISTSATPISLLSFIEKRKTLRKYVPRCSLQYLFSLWRRLPLPAFLFVCFLSSQLLGCHSPDFVSYLTGHPFSVTFARSHLLDF